MLIDVQRRILDNQYIRSLHNPKLRLVKESIKLIKPRSIVTSSGEHNIDFLVSTHPSRAVEHITKRTARARSSQQDSSSPSGKQKV